MSCVPLSEDDAGECNPLTCVRCGVMVEMGFGQYCSQSCAQMKKAMFNCQNCGREFYPRRRGSGTDANRFCSRECAWAAARTGKDDWTHWWFKDCSVCGSRFMTRYKTALICRERNCQRERLRRNAKQNYVPKREPHPCHDCAVATVYGHQRLCAECSRRHRRRFKADRNNPRRRAHKANVVYTSVPRSAIVSAHGTRCWICRERIDMAAKAPAPSSFSVDHVVPLALGGWHDLTNLRPAHFRCNSLRGAEFIGQLMLRPVES